MKAERRKIFTYMVQDRKLLRMEKSSELLLMVKQSKSDENSNTF
jgi:hypothetical protein